MASAIKKLLLLALVPAMAGCAFKYTTTFTVKNLSSQTITVVAGSDEIEEFTLEPGRQRNIYTDSNKCPENYVPMDDHNDDDILPPIRALGTLEIWVDGVKLSDEVRLREYWDYFSTDYAEKYTLNVSDEYISYFTPENQ